MGVGPNEPGREGGGDRDPGPEPSFASVDGFTHVQNYMVDRRGWSSLEACGGSPQERPWLQNADVATAAVAVFTFARCKESHYEYQLAKEGSRDGREERKPWQRGPRCGRRRLREARRTEPRIGRFARRTTTEGDRKRRVDGVAAAAEKSGEKEKRTFLADFE